MANTQASRDDTVDRGGRVNGWSRASADEIAERDALAAGALQVLQAAGCPVQLSPDDCDRERGYVIEVDLGGDAGGGVFLMWNPGGTITAQARDAVLARAGDAVAEDDLEGALKILRELPPKAGETLAPWRSRALQRIAVDRQVASIRALALSDLMAVSRAQP